MVSVVTSCYVLLGVLFLPSEGADEHEPHHMGETFSKVHLVWAAVGQEGNLLYWFCTTCTLFFFCKTCTAISNQRIRVISKLKWKDSSE